MYLDDLPSATVLNAQTYYDTHIPLGYIHNYIEDIEEDSSIDGPKKKLTKPRTKFFVYNHLDIEVTVQENMITDLGVTTTQKQTIDLDVGDMSIPVNIPQSMVRIVGFTVQPRSIPNSITCETGLLQFEEGISDGQEVTLTDEDKHVQFTYTVTIRKSDQAWATRLEQYLSYGNPKLQLEQFGTALLVFVGVSLLFTVALCSALNKDDQALQSLRATYRQRWRERRRRIRGISNRSRDPAFQPVSQRDDIDPRVPLRREVSWKKISGEVFRKPEWPFLLSILTGAGAQCFAVFYAVIGCTIVDF